MLNTVTKKIVSLFSVAGMLTLAACQGAANKPLPAVPLVDLPRFMGDWYVIANIPTFIETDAHNAIESYKRDADGTIAVTFSLRDGPFDGKPKQYKPRGFVSDTTSNAVWDMQFILPIKTDYRITYLTPDYSQTIISREQLDYVWIMARTPGIPDADNQRLASLVRDQGYDVARLQKVPQQGKK